MATTRSRALVQSPSLVEVLYISSIFMETPALYFPGPFMLRAFVDETKLFL
ncbi:hypothetical protein Btus_2945 [Kyrpidia tusciae DSM 2912]|uniref:Uncharacterized protein n=1 Tax=Kyrpidia tusciae (strain DSM 2912 / NBRC 15312 / T2) TaxID=562970 RepID=D5WVN4_KYRT2|nr:hypothetical protein Btus_2945 [Kyrpidia tusciae DSM 2912]